MGSVQIIATSNNTVWEIHSTSKLHKIASALETIIILPQGLDWIIWEIIKDSHIPMD